MVERKPLLSTKPQSKFNMSSAPAAAAAASSPSIFDVLLAGFMSYFEVHDDVTAMEAIRLARRWYSEVPAGDAGDAGDIDLMDAICAVRRNVTDEIFAIGKEHEHRRDLFVRCEAARRCMRSMFNAVLEPVHKRYLPEPSLEYDAPLLVAALLQAAVEYGKILCTSDMEPLLPPGHVGMMSQMVVDEDQLLKLVACFCRWPPDEARARMDEGFVARLRDILIGRSIGKPALGYVVCAPSSAFEEWSRAHKGVLGAVTLAKGPTDMDTVRRLLEDASNSVRSHHDRIPYPKYYIRVAKMVNVLDDLLAATYAQTKFVYMRPSHAC